MKILHLDYDDFNNPYAGGGPAVTTREIYQRMTKRHSVTVITGNYPNAKNEFISGINYKRIGLGNFGPQVSLLSFWILLPFYVIALQDKFDIIVEFFTAPFSASLTPFVAKKAHLAWPTAFFAKDLSKKYNSPFQLIEEFCIKRYKNFVASTKEMRTDLLKINKKSRIEIIPYGFDKHLLDLKTSDKDYALYVGRIDMFQKGVDLIVEAWSRLKKLKIKTKLIIVGNGKPQDETALKIMIKRLNLDNLVEVKGRIFGIKRDQLLANCRLVICPSRFETYCIMALETLAIGKPLVYSDIKGFSWVPKNIGIKFESENVTELANKCRDLIVNPNKRIEIANKAKDFARQYEWDSVTQKYEDLYIKLANLNN